MELTFNKTGELYVAEFKADKEFSLHIERMNGLGSIKMQQNGAEGGKYADVEDFEASNSTKPVIEYDSGAFVAPKWIRIESSVLPTYAAITTEGDVVEIKSQAKVVEITSNGTTSVEPDAGFGYLSGVNVSVNVPQGGGGESGEGGSGSRNVEYLDFTTNSENIAILEAIIGFVSQIRFIFNETTFVLSGLAAVQFGGEIFNTLQYASIDRDAKFVNQNGVHTFDGFISSFPDEIRQMYDSIPRLTEEEFYNLES